MGTDTQDMPIHVEPGPRPGGPPQKGDGPWVTSASGRTHRGCRRDENQDRLYIGERAFAVADGIGGRRGGGVAAEIALGPMPALDRACLDRADVEHSLRAAMEEANTRVRARGRTTPALADMGTTLTAMALAGTDIHVAHVGDSRLYRLRNGVLAQLTTDHTFVQQLVERGQLSPTEADGHPNSNVITRAVGTRSEVEIDALTIDLAVGDTFLICSDGLSGTLDDDTLAAALASTASASDIVDALIDEAIRVGVQDNVTAVVIRCHDPG